jgi:hypothetical protein
MKCDPVVARCVLTTGYYLSRLRREQPPSKTKMPRRLPRHF